MSGPAVAASSSPNSDAEGSRRPVVIASTWPAPRSSSWWYPDETHAHSSGVAGDDEVVDEAVFGAPDFDGVLVAASLFESFECGATC